MRTIKLVLISALFGSLVACPAMAEKYALLVGINDYMYDNPDLSFNDLNGCVNDVRLVRGMLTASFGFREENIRTLLSREATAENVRKAFREHLITQSKPGDWIVFAFSGHGTQIKDFDGDEGDDGKDEILLTTDMNPRVPVSQPYPFIVDDEFGALLDELKGRTVLVLLDCCHSGTATRGVTPGTRGSRELSSMAQCRGVWLNIEFAETPPPATRGAPLSRGAGAPEMPSDVVVCTAAMDHQEAMDQPFPLSDGTRVCRGAFTHYLTEGLRGPADADRSGSITLEEMFNYAQRALKSNGFAQSPTFSCPRGLRSATFFGEQQLPPGAMNVAEVKKDERVQVAQAAHDQAKQELETTQASLAAIKRAEDAAHRAEAQAAAAAKAAQRTEAAALEAQTAAQRAAAGAASVKETVTKLLAGPSKAIQTLADLVKKAQAAESQANAAAERAQQAAQQAKTLAESKPSAASRGADEPAASQEATQQHQEEAAASYDVAKERLALAEREKQALNEETRKSLEVVKQKLASAESEQQHVQAITQERAQREAALHDAEQALEAARQAAKSAEADLAAATQVARQVKAQADVARDAAGQAGQAAQQAAQHAGAAQAEAEKAAGVKAAADCSAASKAVQDAAEALKRAEQAAAEADNAAKQADTIQADYQKQKASAKVAADARTAEKALEQHVAKTRVSAAQAAALVQSARQQLAAAKTEEDAAKAAVAHAEAALAEIQKGLAAQVAEVRAAGEAATAHQATAEKAAADAAQQERTTDAAAVLAQSKRGETAEAQARTQEAAAEAETGLKAVLANLEAAKTSASQAAAQVEAAKAATAELEARAQANTAKLADAQAAEAQAAADLATAGEEKEQLAKTKTEAEAQAAAARERERLENERVEAARREQERIQQEAQNAAAREQEQLEAERLKKEQLETARLERERLEKEGLEKELLAKKAEEAARQEQERLEQEKLAAAKLEQERLEKEQSAKKAEEAARQEQERIEQEKLAAAAAKQKREEEAAIEKQKREEEAKKAQQEAAAAAEAARLERERMEKEEQAKAESEKKKREELERIEKQRKPDEVVIPLGSQAGVMVDAVFAVFPAGGSLDNPTGKIRIVTVEDYSAIGQLIEGTIEESYAVQCIFEPASVRNLCVSVEGTGSAYDAVLKAVKSMPNVDLKKDYEADRRVLIKDDAVEILNQWGDVVRPELRAASRDALAYDVTQLLTMTYFGRQLAEMRNPNPPFRLTLRTLPEGKNVLAYEDPVSFEVTCDKDARIVILYKDSAGDVDMLFPNEYETDNTVKAGIPRCFPDPNSDVEIVADKPTGEVLYKVFAFALDEKLEETFRAGAEYHGERDLKMLIDQLNRILFSPGGQVHWAEANAVQEYRW